MPVPIVRAQLIKHVRRGNCGGLRRSEASGRMSRNRERGAISSGNSFPYLQGLHAVGALVRFLAPSQGRRPPPAGYRRFTKVCDFRCGRLGTIRQTLASEGTTVMRRNSLVSLKTSVGAFMLSSLGACLGSPNPGSTPAVQFEHQGLDGREIIHLYEHDEQLFAATDQGLYSQSAAGTWQAKGVGEGGNSGYGLSW